MFDVGQITRELQADFRLFLDPAAGEPTENLATPQRIAVLLGALQATTNKLGAQLQGKRRAASNGFGVYTEADAQIDQAYVRWKERLTAYKDAVAKAAPLDREAILWDVTAPLLLGFYGGKDAANDPQRPIDAVTVFSLANQAEVSQAWQAEQWDRFKGDIGAGWADITETVEDGVKSFWDGIGTVALAASALVVLLLLLRSRR